MPFQTNFVYMLGSGKVACGMCTCLSAEVRRGPVMLIPHPLTLQEGYILQQAWYVVPEEGCVRHSCEAGRQVYRTNDAVTQKACPHVDAELMLEPCIASPVWILMCPYMCIVHVRGPTSAAEGCLICP